TSLCRRSCMFQLVRESARDVPLCVLDSTTRKAKIGRDPKTCTVQLGTKAVAVSREHADLLWSMDGVSLVDTSSFGTLVNGEKILKCSKLLKGGERLTIGQEVFILGKVDSPMTVKSTEPVKQPAKKSIVSYFTKKNTVLTEESDPGEVSSRRILAGETPSESQESQKHSSQSQSIGVRKATRPMGRRVNPLIDFDEEDESILDGAVKNAILATETPSDSAVTQSITPAATALTRPRVSPVLTTPASTAIKKKLLFAKPSQKTRTQHKPIQLEDDDIMEVDNDMPSPAGGNNTMEIDNDPFVRPSLPRTRSKTASAASRGRAAANKSGISNRNMSGKDDQGAASSIKTQILPPPRKPIVLNNDARGHVSEPPRKKVKSLFAKPKTLYKPVEPQESCLLDDESDGERKGTLNIRYDYQPPPKDYGERPYSSLANYRIMEQMGREAKARLEKKYSDDADIQLPSLEELTSVLCSSYAEEKKGKSKNNEEMKEDEKEIQRVGDETLDEETKSQLVTFCDTLIMSQPSSMMSDNHSQGSPKKGFKKFKKAKQGRFASQSAAFSAIIGGSDLIDFREIQL
ncbi:hypothetical protein PFISCL1PPCAC_6400, partial [Pristionchus fissidentatus]